MKPLLCIVGKSGSGKDYLIRTFGLDVVASFTTRPMRPGEEDGVHHHFVDAEDFEDVDKSRVCAYTFYNLNHYWVTPECLEGKQAYVIDPAGVRFFRNRLAQGLIPGLEIKVIYVTAPAWRRLWRMIYREIRFKPDTTLKENLKILWKHRDVVKRALDRIRHDALEFAGFSDYDAIINT